MNTSSSIGTTNIIDKRLMLKIPEDIIRENILPYTYNTQQKELIMDISSYHDDYDYVESYYLFNYNDTILFFDLSMYNSFIKKTPMNRAVNNVLYDDNTNSLFLFRLLTNKERKQFINIYVRDFDWEY